MGGGGGDLLGVGLGDEFPLVGDLLHVLCIREWGCGEGWVVLLPEQASKLLPWYMQWSHDLAAEMHRRHLIWNKA